MPTGQITPSPAAQQRVFDLLNAPVKNRDDILHLFVTDLGFDRIEQSGSAAVVFNGSNRA